MATQRHPLFRHGLTGVAWRLALAPWPSLLLAAGLIELPGRPLDQWATFVLYTVTKSLTFGVLLGFFTIVIGLPLYLLYRWLRWHRFIAYAAGAAALAAAIYVLPELRAPNESFGFSTATCEVIVSGVRTACGWDQFRESLWHNLAYGALAGAVFWTLLAAGRRQGTQKSSEGAPSSTES